MFPKWCESTDFLVPDVYFGLSDVPSYLTINIDPTYSFEDVVSTIRSIGVGTDSSGYIDNEGIHFHLHYDEIIQVDRSKEFIFISRPQVIDIEHLSAKSLIWILKEPVRKALFISLGKATLYEKTEKTMILCRDLDRIYVGNDCFLANIMNTPEIHDALEKEISMLMKIYEEETLGVSSEM